MKNTIKMQFPDNKIIEFGLMYIPKRKSKAIVRIKEDQIIVFAYFRNKEMENEFVRMLDDMMRAYNKVKKVNNKSKGE